MACDPGRRGSVEIQYDSGVNLSAVFETWHLGDGNYPPLFKGMLVNLSFELEAGEIVTLERPRPPSFQHLGEANYKFVGEVLRVYEEDEPLQRLIVIECSDFRFYTTGGALPVKPGAMWRAERLCCWTTIFGWNFCSNTPTHQTCSMAYGLNESGGMKFRTVISTGHRMRYHIPPDWSTPKISLLKCSQSHPTHR